MGHLRMPDELATARTRRVKNPDYDYFFGQSRASALAYINNRDAAIPGDYVDPWEVFPIRVMKSVDYGIKHGLSCTVTQYVSMTKMVPIGALLHLFIDDNRSIGYYAVRL